MEQFGVYDAKTHLGQLIDRVERGEEIVITRHGKPVARLVPAQKISSQRFDEIRNRFRDIRKRSKLNGLTFREMIDEGRRY